MVKGKGSKKTKKSRRATVNVTPENEDGVNGVDDDGFLDSEDLEYFQDSGRSFAFLQEVAAE